MPRKLSKIQTTTLTNQIVDLLKGRILNGQLTSGQRIWSADLAKEFGVSLNPVKEALLILQGDGLIVNVPRRGSIVRQFTLSDVLELLQVRRLIEWEAARLLIKNQGMTPELMAEIVEHNEAVGKGRNGHGDWLERVQPYRHDRLFHDIIVGACGNRLLAEWYHRLNSQAQVIRLSFWNIGPRGDKTYEEHAAIIKGIEQNDLNAMQVAIKEHLDSIRIDYLKAVKEKGAALGIVEEGEAALPHGRRQLKGKDP